MKKKRLHPPLAWGAVLFLAVLTHFAFAAGEENPSGPDAPTHLRCEGLENPLGIGTSQPRFSWWLDDPRKGAAQSAYRIEVMRGDSLRWDSGKTESSDSVDVTYGGPAFASGERCEWRVKTPPCGNAGTATRTRMASAMRA